MTQVVVFGAGGYSGLELCSWLTWHPEADLAAASSDQFEGRPVSELVPGCTLPIAFTSHVQTLAETRSGQIALLATPAKTAAELAPALLERGLRVIDLSGGHRLREAAYPEWYGFNHPHPATLRRAVYGLPELVDSAAIAEADIVANPGCYATAAALAAGPLVRAGLIKANTPLFVDGKSGTTGAGRKADAALSFSEAGEGIRPYRITNHQHTPEIERTLGQLTHREVLVQFTAHLLPMRRGLLCSVYGQLSEEADQSSVGRAVWTSYDHCPLVRVLDEPPQTLRLTRTPFADVHVKVDERTRTVLAFCAIDNLVKGAAGQAIQNLNLMLGLPTSAGLVAELRPVLEAMRQTP